MALLNLSRLTWEELRDLERSRAVAILPVGALEAHGPHLPLGTDVLIAEAMARSGGEKLARRGLDVLLLPALTYTAAPFAAGFPGTISLAASTVTSVVNDIAAGLARHGVGVLALANAHLDPAHRSALREAAAAPRRDDLRIVFPDVVSRALAQRLGEEFRSGACHAGRYETSVVLATEPGLVREDVRGALPANPRSLTAAIRNGLATFEDAGGPRAYFGDPAAASVEEGTRTVETLGEILEEAVVAALAAPAPAAS